MRIIGNGRNCHTTPSVTSVRSEVISLKTGDQIAGSNASKNDGWTRFLNMDENPIIIVMK